MTLGELTTLAAGMGSQIGGGSGGTGSGRINAGGGRRGGSEKPEAFSCEDGLDAFLAKFPQSERAKAKMIFWQMCGRGMTP